MIVLGSDDANAVWVQGDYHLKSQAGHWDRAVEGWVLDKATSPCIDAGDPNGFIGEESFPNGGFVNIGAYGGTSEASRTYFGGPVCENRIAGDINGDCVVDDTDMDILTSHWLMQGWPTSNEPPSVVIVEPNDGDEFTDAAPMIIRADATDPDGVVTKVVFCMEYMDEAGGRMVGHVDTDPSDGWKYEWSWSNVVNAGSKQVWTIYAQAMDDYGNIAVSPKIKVTVRMPD
ncbi:MAG: Ig-like domain-containing protein [Solirubrobacterales bacterium]